MTQDGKTVQFYDDLLKDKKVLINFIFTRCEQICPLDTAKLASMQRLLGTRVGRDIFMYSITLDPAHDTPEALKAYAEKFEAGPGWLFLTGKREDIDRVRFKLGERREKEEHENTVRVGDVARGQWMRLPLSGDLSYLFVEIAKTLDPNWDAGKPVQSIAEAPRQEMPETGQLLFRNRCAACHTLGKGDRVGPDLKGVTARRELAWIIRYLAAPDQVRASKDPIAVELAKRYQVPMPNLALTRKELTDLFQYLEAHTGLREGSEGAQSAAAHDHHHPQASGVK
ncbi:MAG TPA: SCO family protein [Candidatus Methylomirabilis sp.]|nr:SCO family protein [Candidatus Methylomirabilis sp.]